MPVVCHGTHYVSPATSLEYDEIVFVLVKPVNKRYRFLLGGCILGL